MRIVFAGTPEFAVSSLRAAARHHEVVAVYTQPDRPAGRGRGLAPSPVKLEAVARGIPVYQPESLKDEAAQQQLRDLEVHRHRCGAQREGERLAGLLLVLLDQLLGHVGVV